MKRNSVPVASLPGASRRKKEPNPMAESRSEFMSRWIPMGVDMWSKCEGYGIDWRKYHIEELPFLINLAESQSK